MTYLILEKLAAGDPAAVDQCLECYGGLVWSLARRFSENASDAEDAVQEIFADLWRHSKRFDRNVSAEATFVAMIARRRLIDRRRRHARRIKTTELEDAATTTVPPTINWLESIEEASRIREIFQSLRTEERQVLELSIDHNLTQAEISEKLKLPLGTVKTHARRGLIRLREMIAGVAAPAKREGS